MPPARDGLPWVRARPRAARGAVPRALGAAQPPVSHSCRFQRVSVDMLWGPMLVPVRIVVVSYLDRRYAGPTVALAGPPTGPTRSGCRAQPAPQGLDENRDLHVH